MRGMVPGLVSPVPILDQLPGVYREEFLLGRFTGALDEVLAPVVGTIDNLAAYLDPDLAPADFVDMLGGWLCARWGTGTPVRTRREAVRHAVGVHLRQGTAYSLRTVLEDLTGGQVHVEDGGGTSWSAEHRGTAPAPGPGEVRVTVTVARPADVNRAEVAAIVRAMVPPFVTTQTEVIAA